MAPNPCYGAFLKRCETLPSFRDLIVITEPNSEPHAKETSECEYEYDSEFLKKYENDMDIVLIFVKICTIRAAYER
ncbi:hypothetical protein BS17DRAFT_777800 [Gyrodon lividus]|nr:hypothetical protein BS17DRAFT_777800 [Gyrodon lividus]